MSQVQNKEQRQIRLPKIGSNWGKQRKCYHAANYFNSLSNGIKDSNNIEFLIRRDLLFFIRTVYILGLVLSIILLKL